MSRHQYKLNGKGQLFYGRIRQSKKSLFDWRPSRSSYTIEEERNRLSDPTRTSSKKRSKFDWMCQSDISVENLYEPIASLTPPQQHTHAHTPVPGTTVSYSNACAGLASIAAAAFRPKSAWHIPGPARQQRVSPWCVIPRVPFMHLTPSKCPTPFSDTSSF